QFVRSYSITFMTTLFAAAIIFLQAILAAQKELVAVHIGAVVVAISIYLTVMAFANYRCLFFRNRHRQTIVKDKKFAKPMFRLFLSSILENTALQLIDMLDTLLLE